MVERHVITELTIGRTSYFKVKNKARFEAWVSTLPHEVCEIREDEDEAHGALVSLSWSSIGNAEVEEGQEKADEGVEDEQGVNEPYLQLAGLANHLEADWVAVMYEVFLVFSGEDASDLQTVEARAYGVNAQGKIEEIDLAWIYEVARPLGKYMTAAED